MTEFFQHPENLACACRGLIDAHDCQLKVVFLWKHMTASVSNTEKQEIRYFLMY